MLLDGSVSKSIHLPDQLPPGKLWREDGVDMYNIWVLHAIGMLKKATEKGCSLKKFPINDADIPEAL